MPLTEEKPHVRCAGCDGQFASNQVVQLKGKPYCAACKENVLQDMKAGVSTEGVELAGIGLRFVAQFIDGLIIMVPVMIIGVVFGFIVFSGAANGQHSTGQIVLQIMLSLPYLIYSGLMLNATGGRTLGKKVMKLRVVKVDGSEADPSNFWKREVGRWLLGLLPLIGLIDYLVAFGKGRRTWHDKIGGTIVIRVG